MKNTDFEIQSTEELRRYLLVEVHLRDEDQELEDE